MKRLDEILSKTERGAISADAAPAPDPEIPDCHICGDAGFVRRARPIDHPMFGKAEPCDCVLREDPVERRSRLERIGNLAGLARFTFETFEVDRRPALAELRDAAAAYAAAPNGWLVFTGMSGSGKTHLAAAVANGRVALGEPAFFMVVPDLLDHLRAGYSSDDDDASYERLFEQVRNTPFLVLDDIDAAAPTDWAREKLYQLVNSRFTAELPTVFTCAAVDRLEDRLATRIGDVRLAHRLALPSTIAADSGYHEIGGMASARLGELQFSTFETTVPGLHADERESLELALRVARSFAERPAGWLLIQGMNGCGKTHLAAAIANRVLADGTDVMFAVVPDLLDHLRATYAPGHAVGYDALFEQVRDAGLLVLDDLGAQALSPWAQEKLYQVVNYRSNSRKPTVVTTDLGPAELQSVHPRIYARIADPQVATTLRILAPHYTLGAFDSPAAPRRDRGRR